MIKSARDYAAYNRSDAQAHGLARYTLKAALTNPPLRWQRLHRLTEYVNNCWAGPLRLIALVLLKPYWTRRSVRLGFNIPLNTFGPGLCLPHWGTVVVNPMARIGENCRIHPNTCIAEKDAEAPVIGNGCGISPGAIIVGGITLGDYCVVGANATVTKSFPTGSILAGSPARVVGSRNGPAHGWAPTHEDGKRQPLPQEVSK